ncbi:heterokaryon incompatibility protein-domain-containing protein [Xylariaceae sp. FL1272]|nr:heterokaryon incompatibility protein-domain-containing protein [Xylariaceae sp. FL1272]
MDHKQWKVIDVIPPASQCPLNVCNDFSQSTNRLLYRRYGEDCAREGSQKETAKAALRYPGTPGFVESYITYQTVVKWKRLGDASKAGCPTCGLFTEAIISFYPGGADGIAKVTKAEYLGPFFIITHYWNRKNELRCQLSLSCPTYFGNFQVNLYAQIGHVQCSWPLPPLPASLVDPSPVRKIALVKIWLAKCISTHAICGKNKSSNGTAWRLPKRVVDVLYSQNQIRLHESKDETSQYVCLSHFWGQSQPLRTTLANVDDMRKEIVWEHIPKTFQDAICVVRALGIRYLWIDSLCIVQDDPQDWSEQAALMCDIYSNATLTIFATRAMGCTDTLFPSFQRSFQSRDEEGNPLKLAVRLECLHLDEQLTKYPLLMRGWTFQERLLSQRIIHFGYDQLFWECMEHTACEYSVDLVRGAMSLKSIHDRYPDSVGPTHYRELWHEIVKMYSRLQLTYQSDRPLAVLGLAAEMAPKRRGRYMMGLWEDSLVADLAWAPTNSGGALQRATIGAKLSGPSWSWVSYTYPCEYPDDNNTWSDGDVQIIDIKDQCLSAAGGQAQPCITIKGKPVSGIAKVPDPMPITYKEYHAEGYRSHPWFINTFGLPRSFLGCFYGSTDKELRSFNGDTILCMSLGVCSALKQTLETGLVLRCIDAYEQQYERIGTVQIENRGSDFWADMFFKKHRVMTIGLV